MTPPPERILVAGGGVAAIEAVAALRSHLGPLPRITVLALDPELSQRAASVAAPFGFGAPGPLALSEIARHAPFTLHAGALASVEPDEHVAVTTTGERLAYDTLVVAVGAQARPAVPGALTFSGLADAAAVASAIEDADSVAFVQPVASGWSLPVYELASMTAVEHPAKEVTVVTAEATPLWIFGEPASAAIRELLRERGILLRTGVRVVSARAGVLELAGIPNLLVDRVIALPKLIGPKIPGLPHDADGFIPVDSHGLVRDVADVYAAGDVTSFPLKQGGLAAQQADAVAAAIAARLGAPVVAEPFRPILRGLLLTGGAPLYLRARIGAGDAVSRRLPVSVSRRAFWWPPGKIAGRYIAPLLATARPPVLAAAPLEDLTEREPEDLGEALELALLLAEQDAALGDYSQAVHALDAAAMLTGGVLPVPWAARRKAWAQGQGA